MISAKKIAPLLIVPVLFAVGLAGCRSTPDEVQVRNAIGAIAAAAREGAARDLAAPLSDDFDGNGGELDRRSLGNMVRLLSLRGEHVGVIMGRSRSSVAVKGCWPVLRSRSPVAETCCLISWACMTSSLHGAGRTVVGAAIRRAGSTRCDAR